MSAAMATFRLQYWPGKSREKWKRQSRNRQNRCHTLFRGSLIAHHMYGDSSMITWSHAKPLQLHSWSIIEREEEREKQKWLESSHWQHCASPQFSFNKLKIYCEALWCTLIFYMCYWKTNFNLTWLKITWLIFDYFRWRKISLMLICLAEKVQCVSY